MDINLKNLTEEQKAKAKGLETAEELIAFAEQEGIELSDEQLETISGGWNTIDCGTDPDYR